MPQVSHTTKAEVLRRFRDRLARQVPRFRNRIYIVTNNDLPENVQDHEFLTIQFTGGQFDYRELVGGGVGLVAYQGTIRVSVLRINRKDRAGIAEHLILDDPDGLFALEARILKAMTGSLLPLEPDEGIDESNVDYGILTQEIHPVSDSSVERAPTNRNEEYRGLLDVDFGVDFTWDLSGN